MHYFLPFWRKITRDSFVLKAVAQGITIPLVSKVSQLKMPYEIKMSDEQRSFVDNKIKSLLDSRCIVQLPAFDSSGFLSNIFLVPKKEQNSFRTILNLRNLNSFVRTPHFKMESLKDVQRLVHKHSWICTCDIQDAYPHFAARIDQQKLLQFAWRGRYYAFCTMPQGLANAPYIFTRVCKQIAKFL